MDFKVIITNQMLVIIIELLFLGFEGHFLFVGASLVAQKVKNLPAMQETQVQSLSGEDPLKKEMATTPVFLPGEPHDWKSLVSYSPWGCKESDTTEQLFHFHFYLLIYFS